MNEESESKIKLYMALHGNNAFVMNDDVAKENNCKVCRVKNNGICNIRYGHNRQVLCDVKTGKIITISNGGYLQKTYLDEERTKFIVDKEIYKISRTDFFWFCFGFLDEGKNDTTSR